jgi:uncharacterized glyoxalase superfamily protein PhnB
MQSNRSIPASAVIPELPYDDVRAAARWLCDAFGFAERLRIGDHRVQLTFGGGAIVVVERHEGAGVSRTLVRVDDAQAHYDRAIAFGARTSGSPDDQPFGERQYGAVDIGGHHWTFSQTIADIDPAEWGGELFE